MKTGIKIVGLSGTNGSGKDTVGKVLAEHHHYFFVSVSDLLRDEAIKRGWPPHRESTRTISAEWRRKHGVGILVDRAVDTYKTAGGDEKYAGLVIANFRNVGEADRVHALGGIMLWVDADPRVRYERVQKNSANRGADRAIDDNKTFQQFLADQEAEMHPPAGDDPAQLNMAGVKQRADIRLDNNSNDLGVFRRDIETALGLV